MYDYTHVYENADKMLRYYLDNQLGSEVFDERNFVDVIPDYTQIHQALSQLRNDNYLSLITGENNNKTYKLLVINGAGITFAKNGGYKAYLEKQKHEADVKIEADALSSRKLKIDLANAERVYKTYFSTRAMAIIATIVSVCLLLIKLATIFGWINSKD